MAETEKEKNMTAQARPASRQQLLEVHSLDGIPEFESETGEAEFWSRHSFGEELLRGGPDEDLLLPPPRPRTAPVAVRFDASTLARLKALARQRHKGYQTLLKEFVMERLYEEEKREGIIGG